MVDENTLKESAQILYGCNTDFMWLQRAMNPILNYRDGICKLSVGECTVEEDGGLRRLQKLRELLISAWGLRQRATILYLEYLDIQYCGPKVYITIYIQSDSY